MKASDIKTPFHLLSNEAAMSLAIKVRDKRRYVALRPVKEKKVKAANKPRATKVKQAKGQVSVAQLEMLLNEVKEKMK